MTNHSTCVLRYIKNLDKRFLTFVANRVTTIHDVSSPDHWTHISTQFNPAYDGSRGVPADSLHQWLNEPELLSQPAETWPQSPAMSIEISESNPEIKKGLLAYATRVPNHESSITEIFKKYSNWQRLKKTVAGVLRKTSKLLARIRTGE